MGVGPGLLSDLGAAHRQIEKKEEFREKESTLSKSAQASGLKKRIEKMWPAKPIPAPGDLKKIIKEM